IFVIKIKNYCTYHDPLP
ncbi:N-acetylneuraminate lyase, partial [Haemophilus influenzae]